MTNEMTSGLIKQSEAASYLGLSEATLERDRWRGGDIPYIKVGPRSKAGNFFGGSVDLDATRVTHICAIWNDFQSLLG